MGSKDNIYNYPHVAAHKPIMRWTPELHELFLEAIDKLGGHEKAFPKGILKLMNVEGLTIYHVKSHLQRYGISKYVPELKHDRRASSSEEKINPASTNNEIDECLKRVMTATITKALLLQIEVQKQLHEQVKVQKSLQLLREHNGEHLRTPLEEQEKAGSALIPIHGLPSAIKSKSDFKHSPLSPSASNSPPREAGSRTDSTSSLLSKPKASDSDSDSDYDY